MTPLHAATTSLLLAASSAAWAGDAKTPIGGSSSGDWEFSLSAGPAYRHSGTLGFSGGSRSGGLALPSLVGQDSFFAPPIGAADASGDRAYNDGFVGQDGSTGVDGYTSNWGYDNASQVSGDNIAFHATGFQSIRSDALTRTIGPRARDEERGAAPVLQFDATYNKEFFGIRPGFSASLMWSPIRMNQSWSDFTLSQTRDDFRTDITDLYNLGGLGAFLPSAPYTGSPNGLGFLLENIPDSRDQTTVQVGSENAVFTHQITSRFRADHVTFSFGPTLEKPLAPDWNLQAGLGVSVHWLRWSAFQHERLGYTTSAGGSGTYAEWSDSSSGNKLLGGVYLQLGAEWAPSGKDWSLKSFIRTDLGETFSKQVGPSRITYDTDGFTAAFMFTHSL